MRRHTCISSLYNLVQQHYTIMDSSKGDSEEESGSWWFRGPCGLGSLGSGTGLTYIKHHKTGTLRGNDVEKP